MMSHSAALAFKIVTDPYVGQLDLFPGIFRRPEEQVLYVYNSSKKKRERVGRLLQMHANHREEVQDGLCGRYFGCR